MTYLVAHRGASTEAPENTLAAIQLAWQQNADAVEIDIHWTRDRKLAVIHDGTTKRTGRVNRSIGRTIWDKLKEIDVGRHKGPQFAGERIPLLEEVLATVPPGRRLYIEIKGRTRQVKELDEVLTASGKRHQIVVIGFGLRQLTAFKKMAHDVKVFWLRGPRVRKNPPGVDLINRLWLSQAIKRGLDGLSIYHRDINPALVKLIHDSGMQVNGWTIRSAADARRLWSMGVDSITADSLELVRKAVAESGSAGQGRNG
ncbi:MAG TPA: glycerophosphodiester phosphodiesterase family protein [Planctomycetota bacterium]|nr:glycerophosphodiester phosphodiesterase family protein [Planctomycetota bacterium]